MGKDIDIIQAQPILNYWDHISEYEIDPSWREFVPSGYSDYRENFALAQKRTYKGQYPLSIAIEASYYCNLECPFCPRYAGFGEREIEHMSEGLWEKILAESKENGISAILMDHEAESLMNPRVFEWSYDSKGPTR